MARKASDQARPREWETIEGDWWPFITVELDRLMTAVVGANESGKSQLIEAIEQALTGSGISRRDFCRYSPLFSVQRERVRIPDLGFDVMPDGDDAAALREAGWPNAKASQPITVIRFGDGTTSRIVNHKTEDLSTEMLEAFERLLPVPLVLPKDVPLPDIVLFDELLGRDIRWAQTRRDRAAQRAALSTVETASAEGVQGVANSLVATLTPYHPNEHQQASVRLARTLIMDLCEVAESAFTDLLDAHDKARAGQLGALERDINRLLATRLNFARWWRQDRDFALRVKAQSDELVFTVADRTGAEYSFEERSTGLRFFLGYFVRLQARARAGEGPHILLMDEPDAFLSSVAQADLLRVLTHFAAPAGRPADQVVYVTHSPFLLDKNHPERIRVLDKGSDQEGSRVVADAVRNHYEPLRSSLGAAAAETAFLGGSNLIVEGPADQVYLVAATTTLRKAQVASSRLLDLNEVTIVPAGGATQVPYTAYLARGRDELKPTCVALLDGDKEGRDAIALLRRGVDGLSKRVIEDEFIVDLGDWASGETLHAAKPKVTVREIEDLIPPALAVAAARRYAERLLGATEEAAAKLTTASVESAQSEGASSFDALDEAFAAAFGGMRLAKVGLAKEVARLLAAPPDGTKSAAKAFLDDFGHLIAHLAGRLGAADTAEGDRRREKRGDALIRAFLRDHEQEAATRDEADVLLQAVEATLEGSRGDDAVGQRIGRLRRKHHLTEALLEPVEAFADFAEDLKKLNSCAETPTATANSKRPSGEHPQPSDGASSRAGGSAIMSPASPQLPTPTLDGVRQHLGSQSTANLARWRTGRRTACRRSRCRSSGETACPAPARRHATALRDQPGCRRGRVRVPGSRDASGAGGRGRPETRDRSARHRHRGWPRCAHS